MTKLVILSDTHTKHHQVGVPDGDVLIHCGDWSNGGTGTTNLFLDWFSKLPHDRKILISGNHDRVAEVEPQLFLNRPEFTYLCDSGVEIDGIKFWGSPYTPTFMNWYFMRERGDALRRHWDLIPSDTDVLITHGPPRNILDLSGYKPLGQDENCGCDDLLSAVMRVKPQLHCFGHVHHSYGTAKLEHPDGKVTTFVNAAICNERYHPDNHPWVFHL